LFGSFEGPQALCLESSLCAAPSALMDIHPSEAQDAYGRRRTQADIGLVGAPMWGGLCEILYTYFGEFLF
jgi:hypothetical protein